MKGIVWGLDTESAIKKLEQIETQYKLYRTAELVRKSKTKYRYELVYDNGDRWVTSNASESARGHKCNISYIDVRIDPEVIDVIIKPCTIAGPYQAFHYFYDFINSGEEW